MRPEPGLQRVDGIKPGVALRKPCHKQRACFIKAVLGFLISLAFDLRNRHAGHNETHANGLLVTGQTQQLGGAFLIG